MMSAPIIFTIPKNLITSTVHQDVHITELSPNPSRKRRLDHLTWEEKIQRKKLKNRVAAQTSRDRKKAKMDDMEDRLALLEKTNRKLSEEMKSLKELNERLLNENKELREKPSAAGQGRSTGSPVTQGPHPDPHNALPPLQDLIAQIDSEEYLNCLEQLADSLLREIDSETQEPRPIKSEAVSEGSDTAQVVGPASRHVESNGCEKLELNILKRNADTILAQHSYAHPYSHKPNRLKEEPCTDKDVAIEVEGITCNDSETYFGAYDEVNDCITVVVSSEEDCVEEHVVELDEDMDTEVASYDNNLYPNNTNVKMELLSPFSSSDSSSINGSHKDPSSPAPTFLSDFGYESVESPLSDVPINDFDDLWSESFSELFPTLV